MPDNENAASSRAGLSRSGPCQLFFMLVQTVRILTAEARSGLSRGFVFVELLKVLAPQQLKCT